MAIAIALVMSMVVALTGLCWLSSARLRFTYAAATAGDARGVLLKLCGCVCRGCGAMDKEHRVSVVLLLAYTHMNPVPHNSPRHAGCERCHGWRHRGNTPTDDGCTREAQAMYVCMYHTVSATAPQAIAPRTRRGHHIVPLLSRSTPCSST